MKKASSLLSKWKVIFTLAMFLFAVTNVFAQDESSELEETLQKLSESAATVSEKIDLTIPDL